MREDWAASAAYLSAALKLDDKLDKRLDVWHRLVIAQLAADDLQGYQATCQNIAKEFSNPDPVTANSIAWLSVLGPQPGLPGANLQQLAQTAVRNRQAPSTSPRSARPTFARGDYPKALKTLADSRQASGAQPGKATDEGSETDKLFLALTLEKLDHPKSPASGSTGSRTRRRPGFPETRSPHSALAHPHGAVLAPHADEIRGQLNQCA